MTRNEVIDILEKYNRLLMKDGYCDVDLINDQPTTIDRFLYQNGFNKIDK
jgi:hypothetical protein